MNTPLRALFGVPINTENTLVNQMDGADIAPPGADGATYTSLGAAPGPRRLSLRRSSNGPRSSRKQQF